jgi:hypothetical protein
LAGKSGSQPGWRPYRQTGDYFVEDGGPDSKRNP